MPPRYLLMGFSSVIELQSFCVHARFGVASPDLSIGSRIVRIACRLVRMCCCPHVRSQVLRVAWQDFVPPARAGALCGCTIHGCKQSLAVSRLLLAGLVSVARPCLPPRRCPVEITWPVRRASVNTSAAPKQPSPRASPTPPGLRSRENHSLYVALS